MQVASLFNPVEWSVTAAREPVLDTTDWALVGAALGGLVAFAAATSTFATWSFKAYTRTL